MDDGCLLGTYAMDDGCLLGTYATDDIRDNRAPWLLGAVGTIWCVCVSISHDGLTGGQLSV